MSQGEQTVYVLVIYTGGTIGMKESPKGFVPKKGYLEKLVKKYPNFNDRKYMKKATQEEKDAMSAAMKFKDVINDKGEKVDLESFPLQATQDGYRVIYGILEFYPLLDSSNMTMDNWTTIATTIYKNYNRFEGFVILHGTDTMAYTSSALSFMFHNLSKAVIVTGSQVPLAQLRTDAIENFIGSLILAGRYGSTIHEVGLFFDNTLFRGNRTTKVNASEFDAFESPNYVPLAKIGVNVDVNTAALLPYDPFEPVSLHKNMNAHVGVFMLFPGIQADMVSAFLKAVKGAVILTFGAGNGPDKDDRVFKEAKKHGVLMLNITQCLKGEVEAAYATGTALEKAGLIPGGDMTPEAALTKLSYLLGRDDLTMKEKIEELKKNIRGEVTPSSIETDGEAGYIKSKL